VVHWRQLHSRALALPPSRSLALSLALSRSFALSLSHSGSLTLPLFTLSLSPSHTHSLAHTHTHALSLTHTQSPSLSEEETREGMRILPASTSGDRVQQAVSFFVGGHQPSERDQTALFRSLICTGAHPNPVICSTNQDNPDRRLCPTLRAGGREADRVWVCVCVCVCEREREREREREEADRACDEPRGHARPREHAPAPHLEVSCVGGMNLY